MTTTVSVVESNDDEDVIDMGGLDVPKPRFEPPRRVETLEDLYHSFPTIGDGVFRLRVERKSPKNFKGSWCAGFLCDLDEQVTLDDFCQRFGGGTYSVGVMGPVKGKHHADGSPPIRLLQTVEITCPGVPLVMNFQEYGAWLP